MFKLTDVIKAILAMRILVQFMGQAVGVMLLPSLTAALHTPAQHHEVTLSRIAAVVLLVKFCEVLTYVAVTR